MIDVAPLPWLTAVWAGAGFGLLWWLTRRFTEGRIVRNVLLVSYLLRVVLAVSLFCISHWRLPILSSFQTWPGFWVFSYDAPLYHRMAVGIVDSWAKGIELPYFEVGVEYFALVAAVYKFFGAHPVFPMLLNCVFATLNGILAYRIILRLADRRAAQVGAILVSCWPSSFLWSAQLLKDAPSWSLIFCVLWLLLRLVPKAPGAPRLQPGRRWALLAGALGLLMVVLTRFRFYVATAYSIAAALVLWRAAVLALRRRQFSDAAAHVVLVAVLGLSTLFARTLDVKRLVSPSHPERAHHRMAVEALERGDRLEAKNQFSLAITADRFYKEGYPGLATLYIQDGNTWEGLQLYLTYFALETGPEKRESVKPLIAQLWFNEGNRYLQEGDYGAASRAYESSLQFVPSQVEVYLNLSVTQTYRGLHDIALAVLERARPHLSSAKERRQFDEERTRVLTQRDRYHEAMQEQFRHAQQQPGFEALSDIQVEALRDGWRLEAEREAAKLNRPMEAVPVVAPEEIVSHATQAFTRRDDQKVAETVPEPGAMVGELVQHALSIDKAVVHKTYGATPETLDAVRQAFINEGGHSTVDPKVFISNPEALVTYLPRALAIAFLAPFPWDWARTGGSMGRLQTAASVEALLIYLMLIPTVAACWTFMKRRQLDGLLLAACVLMTAIPISLVIANFGTLFRVRLLFLMPLLLIAPAGLDCCQQWFRLAMARIRPAEDAPERAQT